MTLPWPPADHGDLEDQVAEIRTPDQTATDPSIRTLGTGPLQAKPGNWLPTAPADIANFAEAVRDVIGTAAQPAAGGNITITYDDPGDLIQFAVPQATTAVKGVAELATDTEAVTGTSTGLVVTPSGLKAAITAASASITSVYADTNQTVANATLATDNKLAADLDAGAFYQIDVELVLELGLTTGNAAGTQTGNDIKIQWTLPTGVSGYWISILNQPGAAGTAQGLMTALNAQASFALRDGVNNLALRLIVYTSTTAGQLQMQWAQNAASSPTVDLTRFAGSNMLIRKLN